MANNISFYKDKAKALNNEFFEKFRAATNADRAQRMSTLKPGEIVPQRPIYYGFFLEENSVKFEGICTEYATKMGALADDLKKEIDGVKVAAPSEEAVRAIDALRTVKNPSEDLLMAAMDKYGDNYLNFSNLMGIAKDSSIYLNVSHPVDSAQQLCDLITNQANKYNRFNAERVGSAGAAAVFDLSVDAC